MSSLVGYGVSSESESEEEAEIRGAKTESEKEKVCNFLLESGTPSSSQSESESESDQELQSQPREDPPPSTVSPLTPASPKLPPPALGGVRIPSGSSVFANPFKEQSEAKLSALQKHVQLTLHSRPTHIGGKRVCVAYRKDGRCRFGISCKFAHDSDLQSGAGHTVVENTQYSTYASDLRDGVEEKEQEEDEGQGKRKKHKAGITDSLVPPKRALKQYAKHKSAYS